jgi:hypothetical protein
MTRSRIASALRRHHLALATATDGELDALQVQMDMLMAVEVIELSADAELAAIANDGIATEDAYTHAIVATLDTPDWMLVHAAYNRAYDSSTYRVITVGDRKAIVDCWDAATVK